MRDGIPRRLTFKYSLGTYVLIKKLNVKDHKIGSIYNNIDKFYNDDKIDIVVK